MKIIFIHIFNNYTGSTKVLADVIEYYLNSQQGRLGKPVLITNKSEGFLTPIQKKIKTFYLPYRWKQNVLITFYYFFLTQFRIIYLLILKSKKEDIIYLNTILPFSPYLMKLIAKRNIVHHIHENMHLDKSIYIPARWFYKNFNDKSIFVSKYLSQVTIHKKKSIVVYNQSSVLDNSSLSPELTKISPFILQVSSLKIFKGVDQFIRLAKELPQYNFVLILSANMDEISDFLVKHKLHISKNIKILPYQKNLRSYYQSAFLTTVLTRPKSWVETFGLTIFESLRESTPVIAPNIGGPVELIDNNLNGYLIEDVENLKQIIPLIHNIYSDFTSDKKMRQNSYYKYLELNKKADYNKIFNFLKS